MFAASRTTSLPKAVSAPSSLPAHSGSGPTASRANPRSPPVPNPSRATPLMVKKEGSVGFPAEPSLWSLTVPEAWGEPVCLPLLSSRTDASDHLIGGYTHRFPRPQKLNYGKAVLLPRCWRRVFPRPQKPDYNNAIFENGGWKDFPKDTEEESRGMGKECLVLDAAGNGAERKRVWAGSIVKDGNRGKIGRKGGAGQVRTAVSHGGICLGRAVGADGGAGCLWGRGGLEAGGPGACRALAREGGRERPGGRK